MGTWIKQAIGRWLKGRRHGSGHRDTDGAKARPMGHKGHKTLPEICMGRNRHTSRLTTSDGPLAMRVRPWEHGSSKPSGDGSKGGDTDQAIGTQMGPKRDPWGKRDTKHSPKSAWGVTDIHHALQPQMGPWRCGSGHGNMDQASHREMAQRAETRIRPPRSCHHIGWVVAEFLQPLGKTTSFSTTPILVLHF